MTANDKKFADWMIKVSSVLQKETGGLTEEAISDHNWRGVYDAGEDPEQAAQSHLEELGFIF